MRTWLDHVRLRAVAVVVLLAACAVAHAQTPPGDRARVRMAAKLTSTSAVQTGGSFVLTARLARNDSAQRAPMHEGGAFKMTGALVAAPTVCYADTIFRDDFDGDGF